MKPYQTIPIRECGERLVPIPDGLFSLESPHPYRELGAPYGDRSPFCLRESVLERLFNAQEILQSTHPGWRLRIFDAFRPVDVQQFMVDQTFTDLLEARGLKPRRLSEEQRQEIWAEVYEFWAVPSQDPQDPPPHATGGAVDITLVNPTNQVVNMGSPIDEISPRSHPNYFAEAQTDIERDYHAHRDLLARVMAEAGFAQHPQEWWHFCYGERMWAWATGQEAAIYGLPEGN
ncbi:M15 family metallopeptidase [Sodalinema gerasimenkoae]|uniref:M15 family metallopeptidase n=1 Tax=Sodalinema gerasimenkoae TaxID=2862348 RepID=UPI001359805C|nr:M15 family metallopeptidase [Sodalinema gerasimenkoae]